MTDLQTTVEFSVELYKFYNVDLFQRGYYQIRTSLRVSPKYTSKIEVSLSNANNDRSNSSSDSNDIISSQIVFPSCVVTGTAVSKTFQILYRNEEVVLDDVVLFRVHLIVDSRKIEDSLMKADFQMSMELWFTEQPFGPDHHNSIQCVSSRLIKLHLCPLKGLHHHLPILFDYFHLSAVTLTIHGCLLTIHQPYMNATRPGKPAWLTNSPKVGNRFQGSTSLESVLFGNIQGMKMSPSLTRLSQARCIHHTICTILLSSHECLQSKLFEYMNLLPPWQRLCIEVTDCCAKLKKLKELSKDHRWPRSKSQRSHGLGLRSSFRNMDAEDELLAIVNSDIAQLCAENIILWQQFLECFTLKDRIQQHLTREHHMQRVKRFAEGFFVVENSRQAIFHCAEQSYQTYLSISDTIRKTKYFSSLPSLSVECPDMDGNAETLPVIFEDHYQDMSHGRSCGGGGILRTPSALSMHDIAIDLASMIHKRITSDTERAVENDDGRRRRRLRRKSRPIVTENEDDEGDAATKRPEKTIGCFSTGIVPKSSVSSEDLYYVGKGLSKRKVNHSYSGRKGTSLPRNCACACAASILVDQNDERHRPPSAHPCSIFGGPKTSASAEQIVDRFVGSAVSTPVSSDHRFFRISSSAAVPRYVQAKRKEAFRTSGGSRSLSAVEECWRTLPKDQRSRAFFGPICDGDGDLGCPLERCTRRVRLTTSNSVDHAMPGKHGAYGFTVNTCRPNHRTVNLKRTSNLDADRVHKLDQLLPSASRLSISVDKDLLSAKQIDLVQPLHVMDCVSNSVNLNPKVDDIDHRCDDVSHVKNLKDKLKETMRLDLKPVKFKCTPTANCKTKEKMKDQRIGNKVRKRLNGGIKSLRNRQQSPANHSTSSDSIIVLTGYKKLEQSESLPIALTRVGQSNDKITDTTTRNEENRRGIVENQLIPEEDIDDDDGDLNVSFCLKNSSHRPTRRNSSRLSTSMPNLTVLPSSSASTAHKNKSFSTSTWRSKDADSETTTTTTTELDDLSSSVSNCRRPSEDNAHCSSSDSGHRRILVAGRNTSPDVVADTSRATEANGEHVSDIPCEVNVNCKVHQKSNREGEVKSVAANYAVKKSEKQLRTASNHLLDAGCKKMAWRRASASSISSSSSSSTTSERSGWVSSQCSSLEESSSDVTKERQRSLPLSSSSMLAVVLAAPSSKAKAKESSVSRSNKQKRRSTHHRQTKEATKSSKEDGSLVFHEKKPFYEEIHLPPEEFRDPTPTMATSTVALNQPSQMSSVDEEDSSKRRAANCKSTTGHCPPVRRRHAQQRRSKKADGSKTAPDEVDQAETVGSSPPARSQLTGTHIMRHLPSRREEHGSIPTSTSRKPKCREPMTAEYLNTKCTILEMFSDTALCDSFKSWTTTPPPIENGRREPDSNDDDDMQGRLPVAPPPPPLKAKHKMSTSESLEVPLSSTTTCIEEESAAKRGESNGFEDTNTSTSVATLVSMVGEDIISFVKAKEDFKKQLTLAALICSDCPRLASTIPYFHVSEDFRSSCTEGLHLVVCVHGLDGNSADLRLVKTYLELGLPCSNLEFLMSERNQGDTFSDFEKMTDKLVAEILYHIEAYRLSPAKISFIGHSLGNIIIRSALARPQMKPWIGRLHTFLSLSGPHLGTLYNSSGLVNMGLWFMQKWKKSGSLLQLSMKDSTDIRRTFLYRLSQKSGLEYFKNILLFGSSQDRYVPIHSARIELCKAALKDTSVQGMAYRDMVHGLLQPVARNPNIVFVRYDVHHALPNTANSLIGRAAHIAVLDSELFIEKFLTVCGLEYFK